MGDKKQRETFRESEGVPAEHHTRVQQIQAHEPYSIAVQEKLLQLREACWRNPVFASSMLRLQMRAEMQRRRDETHQSDPDAQLAQVHAAAERGVSGGGGTLPHFESIQASFGRHDLSGVRAHVGGRAEEASTAIGAEAYATGNNVAFRSSPSLHTAAHEAAHVIQQRGGVSLKGGIGQSGDMYERHADAVADLVVQGRSAESLLDAHAGSGDASSQGVQRYDSSKLSYTRERKEFGDPEKDESFWGIDYASPDSKKKAADKEAERLRGKSEAELIKSANANEGGWTDALTNLQIQMLAVYSAVSAGFSAQADAYREAFLNYKGVLDAVSQRHETIASIMGLCLAFTAGVAGKLASGMMARVAGRFTTAVGIAGTQATDAIADGLMDLSKTGLQSASGLIKFESKIPKTEGGFSDPVSFYLKGLASIEAERNEVQNLISWISAHRKELEEYFNPSDLVLLLAPKWAEMKAGSVACATVADTKELETTLWEAWVKANGKRVYKTMYSTREEFDVPKEVIEHLEDDLGVSEARLKIWAGVS